MLTPRMGMNILPQKRFDNRVQSLSSEVSPEERQEVMRRFPGSPIPEAFRDKKTSRS